MRLRRRVLAERLADALRGAAMHLAGQQQRIERRAEVVDHHVIDDAGRTGLWIDLDLGEMGAVGIGRFRRGERGFSRERALA